MSADTPFSPEDPAAQPASLFPDYRSTVLRSPSQPLIRIPQTLTETSGLSDGWDRLMGGAFADLTTQHEGVALGQRIVVTGRVLDENGRPVPRTVIEIWQANSAGRYAHTRDQWDAPLDPNFSGAGRVVTDDDGAYRYVTRAAWRLSLGQPR